MVTALRKSVIGQSIPRLDGPEKVTGKAQFVGDLTLPGMLHGKIVLSPHAHARIVSIDPTGALAVSGVVAALTRDDVEGLQYRYGLVVRDQTLVAMDRVRYQGDVVAAIAAVDEGSARAGCEAMTVEYDPLPSVVTIDDALADGAPVLHETTEQVGHIQDFGALQSQARRNVCHHYHREVGDVKAAFAAAEVVVEDSYTFPTVYHQAMEPHGVVAAHTPEGITVWAPTQYPFPVQALLSEMFSVPQSKVRVIVPYVGGGFGGKEYFQIIPIAVALSRKTERPVRIVLSSEEAFATLVRHAARIHVRTGARRDGTLLCREATVYLDTGAYADSGPRVASSCGYRMQGPYRIPHVRVDAYAVYTNKTPAGACRGIGAPQAAWAYEGQMDHLAQVLGMDPLAIRLKNALRSGDQYDPNDSPIDGDLPACLQAVARAINWSGPSPSGRARAIACGFKNGGGINVSSAAIVRLLADGSLVVLSSTSELGQGSRTVLAQIAAATLGIPIEQVTVVLPDTALTPYDQRTAASRSTAQMGAAIQDAIHDICSQLAGRLGRAEGIDQERIQMGEGRVRWPGGEASLADVLQGEFGSAGGELIGRGYYTSARGRGTFGGLTPFWEMGAAACEVEVDSGTGQVKVLRYVSSSDVGRAINPQTCEGQEEGAVMMGFGHSLSEKLIYADGQLLNGNLVDYRIPTFDDVPEEFTTILVENGLGPGPFGSRGAGETGIIPVAPVIAAAAAQLTGTRSHDLPLDPERMWVLMRKSSVSEGATSGRATR